jgi:fermentation-respiration switch protein FrsA (DUF1100 family)
MKRPGKRPAAPDQGPDVPPRVGLLGRLMLLSPYWTRTVWHRLVRLSLYLIFAYLGVTVMLLALENWFLFHPEPALASWDRPPSGLEVEDVHMQSADEMTVHGWWAKPVRWKPEHGAILYFHGNAGNLSHRGDIVQRWRDELRLAVLIIDYPGFGQSEGSPTEAGCNAAGDAAYDWLTRKAGVPGNRIVLVGGSLGGSVATHLATLQPYRALVLISTFTSFPDMAQKTFPWLPCRWLVRNQMNNLARISTLKEPVFIAHSPSDGLVPYWMGQRLFAAANEPKRFFTMHGRPHDEFVPNDCFAALKAFLDETDVVLAMTTN